MSRRAVAYRAVTLTAGVLASTLLLAGCVAPAQSEPPSPAPTHTRCVDAPELTAAVDLVWAAKDDPSGSHVYYYGGGRRTPLFDLLTIRNLAAMPNPHGAGVVVSVVYFSGKIGFRDSARRLGWLVLDGEIYPVDVEGAQAFGSVLNGFPPTVEAEAGLDGSGYEWEAFGLDDIEDWNADTYGEYETFLRSGSRLCSTPTALGS